MIICPFLVFFFCFLLFQTILPIYVGLERISLTEEIVHSLEILGFKFILFNCVATELMVLFSKVYNLKISLTIGASSWFIDKV